MEKTLVVRSVKCVKPATGIDDYSRGLFAAIGFVAGGVAATGATVASGGVLIATVGIGAVGGAGIGVVAIEGLDHVFSGSDDLYIKVNNNKVWGGQKGTSTSSQQQHQVDYSIGLSKEIKIELMEWDKKGLFGSDDDSLGTLIIPPKHKEGAYRYLVPNEDEGSVYEIWITVLPSEDPIFEQKVTLKNVKCISPASGIDDVTRRLFAAIGAVAGGVAAAGATTASGGVLIATVGLGAVAGAGAGVFVIEGLDHVFSGSDDLYIKVNNNKVWGGQKGTSTSSQQQYNIDLEYPLNEEVKIELMEWDFGSDDDSLGYLSIPPGHINGEHKYLVQNDKEGSVYEVTIEVKPIQRVPNISWPIIKNFQYGETLASTQSPPVTMVPGRFEYSIGETEILEVGTHTQRIDFIPDEEHYYYSASVVVNFNVYQAIPNIYWPEPEAIIYGDPLEEKHLNAIAEDIIVGGKSLETKGVFEYFWNNQRVKPGYKLKAGLHTLIAKFEPDDLKNISKVEAKVPIRVWLATYTFSKYEVGNEETFSHLALKHYGHATPYYWQWIIDHNKGIIPENYKLTRAGTKVFIPEPPPGEPK